METRYVLRVGITILVALSVLTGFVGSAAAQEIISINEDDDALVTVDGSGGAGSSGGGGGGAVEIGTEDENVGGSAEVDASPDDGVSVDAGGGGESATLDQAFEGGIECNIAPEPSTELPCTVAAPGGGGGGAGPQIDTEHESSVSSDGGSGSGGIAVTSDQGSLVGEGAVDGSLEEGLYLAALGGGSIQGEGATLGIECDIPAGPPDDPASVCEPVGADGGLPLPPGDLPPGDLPPGDLPPGDLPPGDLLAL